MHPSIGGTLKAEDPLKSYTKRMRMQVLLGEIVLKLISTQRRMERYRVMFVWKIITDLVPNPGITW
jgi:hypothetical protein